MRRVRKKSESGYVAQAPKVVQVDARQLALELMRQMSGGDGPAAPTLKEFAPRWIDLYAKANRQKPSGVSSKQDILDTHLLPRFAERRLDSFTEKDVQELKGDLWERKSKTVNNILCVLNKLLKTAVKWHELRTMPVDISLYPPEQPEISFYEFEDYDKLVAAAQKLDHRVLVTVLLGGDAGLRTGEMIALEWGDVDFKRGFLNVARSQWNGQVTTTKGRRSRRVPMTQKLAEELRLHRHKDGPRVLYRDGLTSTSKQVLSTWMIAAQKAAGLEASGNKHILRHTFCSHLAMRGATLLAIKELAGHRSVRTTLRYMHLSPNERDRAIGLLDQARAAQKQNGDAEDE